MIAPELAVEEQLITGEELLGMGDIGSAELIDGRIVPMSPTGGEHGRIETEISFALRNFVGSRKLGGVMSGEVGIFIRRNPDRIRAADVAFLSRQRLPQIPRQGFLTLAPELVVEIVSPSDRWDDLREKIKDYFSIGVERVWIVEPEQKDILIFRAPLEFHKVEMGQLLQGEGILQGFTLNLTELFEPDRT